LKGHIAIDPDAEIVAATVVSAGNPADAASAGDLLPRTCLPRTCLTRARPPWTSCLPCRPTPEPNQGIETTEATSNASAITQASLTLYGEATYGAGALLADLEAAGADILCKGPPAARAGRALTQGRFKIETAAGSVTCPGGVTAPRRPVKAGGGTAAFVAACRGCPLAAQCTTSAPLRRFTIGRYEAALARARTTQAVPA